MIFLLRALSLVPEHFCSYFSFPAFPVCIFIDYYLWDLFSGFVFSLMSFLITKVPFLWVLRSLRIFVPTFPFLYCLVFSLMYDLFADMYDSLLCFFINQSTFFFLALSLHNFVPNFIPGFFQVFPSLFTRLKWKQVRKKIWLREFS